MNLTTTRVVMVVGKIDFVYKINYGRPHMQVLAQYNLLSKHINVVWRWLTPVSATL
jgi:hypothetical protein